jgi:NAD(P)-dependent dehydrogenase (short-subunit alcohol dehydrogenase family)
LAAKSMQTGEIVERTIAITGGTGGLGTALANRLLAKGARLAISYLLPDEAARFEEEVDTDERNVMMRRVDATDHQAVEHFFNETVDQFGHVDGVAALVGGWAGGRDVEATDDVRFERMIDLNLRSTFNTLRAAIPHLKQAPFGRIVTVGSRAALENPAGQAAFNMAKAGVMSLGLSIAAELEPTDVTSAVLVPSVIDTPATRSTLPYADYVNWPTPDEIAAVTEFLLSEEAGVMNGALVPVYGRS